MTSDTSIKGAESTKGIASNTVFTQMNNMATEYDSVNLGHGFPDYPAPQFIKEAASTAISNNLNQYTSARGVPRLRQVLVERMQNLYNVSYDMDTDILVTQGATEAIFVAMMGLLNPGDEVIIFEPCYNTYLPTVKIAGAIPKLYTLLPPDWSLDEARLSALFSEKTKMILLNTPHNPTGKVFNDEEMALIAKLCQKYNVIAISDEVYDEIIFGQHTHRPLCTYPGMYERTLTVSTLGKVFAVTGWKVGWCIGPKSLVEPSLRIRQYSSGSGVTPVQEAAAQALSMPRSYYTDLANHTEMLRDYCCSMLQDSGFKPFIPNGTFFLMADYSEYQEGAFLDKSDVEFCTYLTKNIGVTAIPGSSLYHSPLPDKTKLVRFAFCKKKETLIEAHQRLSKNLVAS